MPDKLPIGAPVESGSPDVRPGPCILSGSAIRLRPVEFERDAAPLYAASHGSAVREALFTYLPYGPFGSVVDFRAWLESYCRGKDPLFFVVEQVAEGVAVGMVSYMNIRPEHRSLEIGHIWYGPDAQRTRTNTEAVFLLLRHAFEDLHQRRIEWKCDSLNARSRAAAERLGFRFEGLFRQHVIYKERNRDTTWFALLDQEWPAVRAAMQDYLAAPDGPGLRERIEQQRAAAGS